MYKEHSGLAYCVHNKRCSHLRGVFTMNIKRNVWDQCTMFTSLRYFLNVWEGEMDGTVNNCVHKRRCSHLKGVHNEGFHCIHICMTMNIIKYTRTDKDVSLCILSS